MAQHPSAEKRHRQTTKRRTRNRVTRGSMRTAIKAVEKALSEGKKGEAKTLAGAAIHLIDRACVKGVIKANTASRLVSNLTLKTKS